MDRIDYCIKTGYLSVAEEEDDDLYLPRLDYFPFGEHEEVVQLSPSTARIINLATALDPFILGGSLFPLYIVALAIAGLATKIKQGVWDKELTIYLLNLPYASLFQTDSYKLFSKKLEQQRSIKAPIEIEMTELFSTIKKKQSSLKCKA